MASGPDFVYEVPEEAAIHKVGAFTYYEVECIRQKDGETWKYWLAADCGSYRGSFGKVWLC